MNATSTSGINSTVKEAAAKKMPDRKAIINPMQGTTLNFFMIIDRMSPVFSSRDDVR